MILSDELIDIMHANVRGWLTNSAELTAAIRMTEPKPVLVCVNETFLTKAIESISIEGYSVVGRRDRKGQFGGGVAIFVRKEFAERVTLVMESEVAERLWCVIHSDQGPFAVCSWYRPPARGGTASIDSFASECDEI